MTTPKEALEQIAARSIAQDDDDEKELRRQLYHIESLAKSALASLQGEDAVERVARVISRAMLDNPTGGTSEERAAKRRAIASEYAAAYVADCATGLVPDEAAIRADEREKCAARFRGKDIWTGEAIAAAIRSGGGE